MSGNLIRVLNEMATHHIYDLGIHILSDNASLGGDILEHFMKSLGLDLLALELRARIVEIEQDFALGQFLDEKLGAIAWRSFWRRPSYRCGLRGRKGPLTAERR